jgi:hypothetical protein
VIFAARNDAKTIAGGHIRSDSGLDSPAAAPVRTPSPTLTNASSKAKPAILLF